MGRLDRYLVTIRLVDGAPGAPPGETAIVPEVGDVVGEEDGRVWVVASSIRTDNALLLTVEAQTAPSRGGGRA